MDNLPGEPKRAPLLYPGKRQRRKQPLKCECTGLPALGYCLDDIRGEVSEAECPPHVGLTEFEPGGDLGRIRIFAAAQSLNPGSPSRHGEHQGSVEAAWR